MHQYWSNFIHTRNPNVSNVKYPSPGIHRPRYQYGSDNQYLTGPWIPYWSDWTPVYANWKRFGDGKGWLNMGMNILLPDEERDTSSDGWFDRELSDAGLSIPRKERMNLRFEENFKKDNCDFWDGMHQKYGNIYVWIIQFDQKCLFYSL